MSLNTRATKLIQRFSFEMMTSQDRTHVEKMAKGMLFLCWKILPVNERRRFIAHVDFSGDHEFIEFSRRWPDIDDPVLEAAARSWGYVQKHLSGEDRQFGLSVQALLKRRGKPSEKQAAWMKRLYDDWKTSQDFDEGVVE
ncbi:hypothetical protein [Pseudooceanicola nitratireducens]|uniref:hypothetical protein n=1 Tax=Pseudooceanicola nitratireducens TaxID=517719 RepID=UPI003C7EC227